MRLTIRKLVVLAIGIVIALLIAACGSGTEAFTGAKTPSTEATTRSASSTSGSLAVPGMTEADVLKALSAYAGKLAGEDELSGAVLIARDDRVLFSHAYGLADRTRGIPNTVDTRFRMGSMNKMFTAVAILQLVEAGKVKLTAPLGTYVRDYPNREFATKVTIRPAADPHRRHRRHLRSRVRRPPQSAALAR